MSIRYTDYVKRVQNEKAAEEKVDYVQELKNLALHHQRQANHHQSMFTFGAKTSSEALFHQQASALHTEVAQNARNAAKKLRDSILQGNVRGESVDHLSEGRETADHLQAILSRHARLAKEHMKQSQEGRFAGEHLAAAVLHRKAASVTKALKTLVDVDEVSTDEYAQKSMEAINASHTAHKASKALEETK